MYLSPAKSARLLKHHPPQEGYLGGRKSIPMLASKNTIKTAWTPHTKIDSGGTPRAVTDVWNFVISVAGVGVIQGVLNFQYIAPFDKKEIQTIWK